MKLGVLDKVDMQKMQGRGASGTGLGSTVIHTFLSLHLTAISGSSSGGTVHEGRVENVRDGIFSRIFQRIRDGGANLVLYQSLNDLHDY